MDILQEENIHMAETEIRLLDGDTCLSKIIICHVCWSEINSKLFFPKAFVLLGCFSYIGHQYNFANDLMRKTTQENNSYWEK